MIRIIRQLHGSNNGSSARGDWLALAFDRELGHLWLEGDDGDEIPTQQTLSCACGGIQRYPGQELVTIPLVGSNVSFHIHSLKREEKVKKTKDLMPRFNANNCEFMDSYPVKSKMLETALEVSLSLSSIGMAIQM